MRREKGPVQAVAFALREPMKAAIGIDLGGNSINLTAYHDRQFLIPGMLEIPSLVSEGPEASVKQMLHGFHLACETAGLKLEDVGIVGLDTPGPASADGVMGKTGGQNFSNTAWHGFPMRAKVEEAIGLPTTYLNDGNSAALYAHHHRFGQDPTKSSVSLIIGTGLGGGIVVGGRVHVGKVGFAAELGHVRLPGDWTPEGWWPSYCSCGRRGDLESIASLSGIINNHVPRMLPRYPGHPLAGLEAKEAGMKVRGMAEAGDPMCREILRIQTEALAAHIDQMVNVMDPDAVFIGGGGIQFSPEVRKEMQDWYLAEIRAHIPFRPEQADLIIEIAGGGDMAGARGSAIYAAQTLLVI
jgi:glucokinase